MPKFKLQLNGVKEIARQLEKEAKQSEAAIGRAIYDIKKRAPGIVSQEVTAVYKIPKSEIMPRTFNKRTGKWTEPVGGIKVVGRTIDNMYMIYSGRPLTPTHFGMSPKFPPHQKGYTLKVEIIKGRKAVLGRVKRPSKKTRERFALNFKRQGTRSSSRSPVMLLHTGALQPTGTQYIPFRRNSTNRTDVEAIHTLGVPQMVEGHTVKPKIEERIEEMLGKRLTHHLKL